MLLSCLTSARGRRSVQTQSTLSTSFTLETAATTGTYPFTIGLGLKKGDATDITTDLSNYQVEVLRTWSDGSIKHCVVSGRAALTQNTPLTVNVSGGTSPGGTALTASDIQTAAPSASVQCGSNGTVSLSSLLASPVRTFISGPEMVECHYRADVGGGTLLSVWFHVRLFADDRVWVRAICENGYLDNGSGAVASNAGRSYVPTVAIGGSNVYTNGGASLSHYENTRWSVEGWIGGDPQVTFEHDVAYLDTTKLFPHYGWDAPDTGTVFSTFLGNGGVTPQSWAANYTPMAQGDWDGDMGATGYQPFIGLLPLPNALYLTTGDSRMLRYSLNNSSALNSRPIVWRDKTTNLIPEPSDFTTWSVAGPGGSGEDKIGTGAGLFWEQPHHPLEGYFAYLLTGDYWHYETLAMGACCNYVYLSSNRGNGTARIMKPTQIRGCAWMMRTVGAYAAIAPTGDAVAADYRSWLETGGFDYWATKLPSGGVGLGYLVIGLATDPGAPLRTNPWQQHFWIAVNGFLWDIEPGVASTANQQAIRDFMYKGAVGILGGNGTSNYCYTNASLYDGLIVSDGLFQGGVTDYFPDSPVAFYNTSSCWGDAHEATHGSANTSCGTSLGGSDSGTPANAVFGYWGNLLPAIAYAVDHGATDAAAAWARLTGASNWGTIDGAGFDDTPVWGVTPR